MRNTNRSQQNLQKFQLIFLLKSLNIQKSSNICSNFIRKFHYQDVFVDNIILYNF